MISRRLRNNFAWECSRSRSLILRLDDPPIKPLRRYFSVVSPARAAVEPSEVKFISYLFN